ncbi:MAG TPA: MBL fold metallo-hydrolase [Thermomicrobiales bacterium]|jgi:glyoxylase-like metal-dependent hydrolase (beta-lactamase superfamily II)
MRRDIHGEALIQLTHFPILFPVSCYLVREADGLTLIDTGLGSSVPAILAAAESAGAPIRRIAVTHVHMDHVAALDGLHVALPQAEVLIPARESRFLAGDLTLDPAERLPGAKLRGGWAKVTSRPTRTLVPGDRVGSLLVVAAPGHTPGHVAYFDTRDRTLIAGDAFFSRGGVDVAGKLRVLFPFPSFATWHKPTALASARALRALEPTRLAVGHGPVTENPLAAMDHAIAAAGSA